MVGHEDRSVALGRRGRAVARWHRAAAALAARDEPPTSQLPVRMPYQVRRPDRQAREREAEIERALQLLIRLGELLMSSGAGSADVELAVIAVASALGLRDDIEVAVTHNEIQVMLGATGAPAPMSRLRVVRRRTADHTRLVEAHQLVLDLTDGVVALAEASDRLERIRSAPRRYPRWGLTLAWGTLVAAVGVQLGGGWRLAAITFATAVLVDRLGRALARRHIADFFLNIVGASIATMVAVGLTALDLPLRPALVVAGGVVLLLPGLGLLGAVQDALTGFVVTAAGRSIEVAVLIAGITTGVAATLVVGRQLGVVMPAVQVGSPVTLSSLPAQFLSAGVVAAMMALGLHAPRRLLPPAFVLGGTSYVWFLALDGLLGSPALGRGAVAVGIGLCAAIYGTRRRVPSLTLVVPGLTPLLPGLALYAATLELTQGDSLQGIVGLLGVISSALALAAGAILGDQLGDPLRREMLELQRRTRPRGIGRRPPGYPSDGA